MQARLAAPLCAWSHHLRVDGHDSSSAFAIAARAQYAARCFCRNDLHGRAQRLVTERAKGRFTNLMAETKATQISAVSEPIGEVITIHGPVQSLTIFGADGLKRAVMVGDKVYAFDIVPENEAAVTIALYDGTRFDIGKYDAAQFSASDFAESGCSGATWIASPLDESHVRTYAARHNPPTHHFQTSENGPLAHGSESSATLPTAVVSGAPVVPEGEHALFDIELSRASESVTRIVVSLAPERTTTCCDNLLVEAFDGNTWRAIAENGIVSLAPRVAVMPIRVNTRHDTSAPRLREPKAFSVNLRDAQGCTLQPAGSLAYGTVINTTKMNAKPVLPARQQHHQRQDYTHSHRDANATKDAVAAVRFGEGSAALSRTNLLVVFDRSGSMRQVPQAAGFATRLDLVKTAVNELIDCYAGCGEVNVLLVDFATEAAHSGWLCSPYANTQAIEYLDELSAGGWTNYQAALSEVRNAFGSAPGEGSYRNLAYFITDGVPTRGGVNDSGELPKADIAAWKAFLSETNIEATYAIGVGDDAAVADEDLCEVAFPDPGSLNTLIVPETQLIDAVLRTAPHPAPGAMPELLFPDGRASAIQQ